MRSLLRVISLAIMSSIFVGCACPGGKEYRSIDGERINQLKSKFSKMSQKELDGFIKDLKLAKDFLPQQVIVKFKDDTSASKVAETLNVLGATSNYQFKSSHALLLKIPSAITSKDVLAIITALNQVESVDYAVPNGILKVSSIPNDPNFDQQEDLTNIKAQEAWALTQGSRNVLVGIIDTGVDYLHPDLVANIWTNPGETGIDAEGNDKATNGIDDDNNGYVDDVHGYDFVNNDNDPMDDHGHGTHVAGTIGATGNNGIGITGINWRVSIVPLKFIAADGSGSEADAIKAIDYATQMHIPVTNNSWGGLGYNQALKEAIEANANSGALFVAAAGNNSIDNDLMDFFPANYGVKNIISVAAVDNRDEKPAFSNWGARKVDIAAPGVEVASLAVSGSEQPTIRMSGTSMAAPHVTGAAALIKSFYPDSDYRALKNRILFGADSIPQLLSPNYTFDHFRPDGYPIDKPLIRGGRRLNIAKSLERDFTSPGSIERLEITFSGLTQLEVKFKAAGDDGNEGEAAGYLAVVSSTLITSETAWARQEAIELTYVKTQIPGGIAAEISDLTFMSSGFVTLRAIDKAGNLGPISPSIPFELSKAKVLFLNDGESYEGINSQDLFMWTTPFQQEEVPGRGKVWSDSPNAPREIGNNYMEFTQSIEVTHPDVVLQFDTKLDCTAFWERAQVEIRINEETDPFGEYGIWNPERRAYDWFPSPVWRFVALYSAPRCDWTKVTIPLRNKLKVGDKIRFRFWYKGAGSIQDNKDGWLIDDIKVLGPSLPEKPTNLQAVRSADTGTYGLKWVDNSSGETRFEVRSFGSDTQGVLFAETPVNMTQYETGITNVDPTLRVRACNGIVCSEYSDLVRVINPPPQLISIAPPGGPIEGGNTLTVIGSGFMSGAVIRIGGVDCRNTIRVSASKLTCSPAARAAGAYPIKVINPDQQPSAVESTYNYRTAPSINSISPVVGQILGGENLTITGLGFVPGIQVQVGSKSCGAVTWISETQIRCIVPTNNEGSYPIRVTNTDGQFNPNIPQRSFRVVNPRWVSTVGGSCSSVCASVGLSSRPSPEGSFCSSGENIPASAVGKVTYRNGCWPFRDCRSQGVRSAIQVGSYCYGASQKRDRARSDITMGCFCGL